MNFELIRKIVEEEVLKSLSSAKSTVRMRRPVVSESMIVAARRRGSKFLSITPGSIVTPAARERAAALGVAIEESRVTTETTESRAITEAVMASVIAALSDRPAWDRHSASPQPAHSTSRPEKIAKKLITASDLEILRFRAKVITVGKRTIMTPLARDLAVQYGVRIIED